MYTNAMKNVVNSIPVPKDFLMDIVDYNTFLTLQFYESQWNRFTDKERLRCILYLQTVKSALEKQGAIVALDPIMDLKTQKQK